MKRIVCEGDSSRTHRDVTSLVIRGTRLRIMTARRRVVELAITDEDVSRLMAIARSRTEPASPTENDTSSSARTPPKRTDTCSKRIASEAGMGGVGDGAVMELNVLSGLLSMASASPGVG